MQTSYKLVLKYILINAGFVIAGFLMSFVFNFAVWFGVDDTRDMGLGNLFLTTTIMAILGLTYTGCIFFKHKILLVVSILGVVGALLFLNSLFYVV